MAWYTNQTFRGVDYNPTWPGWTQGPGDWSALPETLAVTVLLFHLGNAAMLPLLGQELVARDAGAAVLGYAYAAPYHARPAYRLTCENSIYVREDRLGQGIGTALLTSLIEATEAAGMRQMVALIAGTETASVALHEKSGFRHCGRLEHVGRKFGQWLDVIFMQRSLGAGAGTPPDEEPG